MLEALNTTSALQFGQAYVQAIPSLVMQGDVSAIVIGLILFYIALIALNKISFYLLKVIKYVVVLAIVLSAFYSLVMTFIAKFAGAQPMYMLLGLIGLAVGFVGVIVALYALYKQATRTSKLVKARDSKMLAYQQHVLQQEKEALEEERKELAKEKVQIKQNMLQQLVKKQGVLLTIITYIMIAEFGVFSSVTISAPTPEIGIIMVTMFVVGVIAYVYRTYPDPMDGMKMLGVAFIFAFVLSLVLGHFWVGHEVAELLSVGYFALDSMVAFITGVALSLFMGSKG